MNLLLQSEFRLRLPQPTNLSLQSFYIFNLYRAGSSVVTAVAESLARVAGRVENDVSRAFYDVGVEFFDAQDFSKSSVFLAQNGAPLLRLCEIGGYVHHGFREVPKGFAEGFTHLAAAILVVRDPRDIGISQYNAVANHVDSNRIVGDQIRRLREQIASMTLEQFLLSEDTLGFLNRIGTCYEAMIRKGMTVVQYEDLFLGGHFSTELLCERIYGHFQPYDDGSWSYDAFVEETNARIRQSPYLQGHATGGQIRMSEALPSEVKAAYTAELKDALQLLNYL